MTIDIAHKYLNEGYTCIIFRDEIVYYSQLHGIKPLVEACDSSFQYSGFTVVDKIIGKAAALLLIKMKVSKVSSLLMTYEAKMLLDKNNIQCEAKNYSEKIINRDKTDLCPMEKTVLGIDDPELALKAIKDMLKRLSGK